MPSATDIDTQTWPEINESNLNETQRRRLHTLLSDYKDVFAFTPEQLGRTSVVKHTIDAGDHAPIRLRSYSTLESPSDKTEIDKQIQDMLTKNIIHLRFIRGLLR